MIRIAIAAALASFVVYDAAVVPSSTGTNEAIERPRGMKSDRLPVLPAGTNCADAAWPYYRGDCVRGRQPSNQAPAARFVRIVAADRTPPGDVFASFAN